jgi:transposase
VEVLDFCGSDAGQLVDDWLCEDRRTDRNGMSVEVMLTREARRRWSEAAKARILEEALAPGAVVAEVARRYQVASSLIFTWRSRMMRRCSEAAAPSFVPVLLKEAGSGPPTVASPRPGRAVAGMMEAVLRNGRVLRMSATTEPARLVAFVAALEA